MQPGTKKQVRRWGGYFPPTKKKLLKTGESATKQEEVASGKRFRPTLPVLRKGMNLQTLFVCVCSEDMHSFIEGENENDKKPGAVRWVPFFFLENDKKIIDFS